MNWDATKSSIIALVGELAVEHGFSFAKGRSSYESKSPTERRCIRLRLVGTEHGNYLLEIWAGIRNNIIEDIFHRTSEVDAKYHADYTTLDLGAGTSWHLNNECQVVEAKQQTRVFVINVALPFLKNAYTYVDYSRLLNDNPETKCPYHANDVNRCHHGLIAAKLSGDPRYAQLKNTYSNYLKRTNNGFYLARFERLISDLDAAVT